MNRRKIVALVAALGIGAVALTGCEMATEAQIESLASIKIGDSPSQVRNVMGGEPSDKQTFDNTYGKSECWYYGLDVQICFDDGHVTSKNNF